MEEGVEDQGVGVEGYHKVSKRQTHHKHITWKDRGTVCLIYLKQLDVIVA